MLADERALKLPPPYNCFIVDPLCTLLTLLWRYPTPALDHVDHQDDFVFLGLKSDWKDKVRALHAHFYRIGGSEGSSMKSHDVNGAPEGYKSYSNSDSDNNLNGEDSNDDDDYMPPSDCSDEEDHEFEVDDGETEPWLTL